MNLVTRIWKSLLNGTWPVKILNRVSHIRYVPSSESLLEAYLAERFPSEDWKNLSSSAKQLRVELFDLFSMISIQDIAYVGANEGEMALAIDQSFPGKYFYLIEPVPNTFKKLSENIGDRPHMQCINFAAGAKEHYGEIFADDFSPASSFLAYEELALQEFPRLGKGHMVQVPVKPLDNILAGCGVTKIDMLIMDVQGYENEVLQGATRTLKTCKAIMSELSLQPLYLGSSTFDSVYQLLQHEGFYLKYLINPILGASRKILQIDGVFLHKDLGPIRFK